MGIIKTRELANKNIELEITYGGVEAPFMGIDSSAPPAYIDPKCQVDIDGFVIVENQLVAAVMQLLGIYIVIPGSGFSAPKLGGFGSFYAHVGSFGEYQNFVYIIGDSTYNSGNNTYTTNVVLYVWPSSNTATPTAIPLSFTQPVTTNPGTPATMDILTGVLTPLPPTSVGNVAIQISNASVTENYGPYASTLSQSAMATAIAADINGLPSAIVTATVDSSGTSVTLATIDQSAAANNTQIQINSIATPNRYTGTYAYYSAGFQGGSDAYTYPTAIAPYPLSFVSEGENLYLGGPGTVILQYTNEIFSILEQYVGANVLKKFGGSLIALGITPSPGTIIQSPEMVMAWSAAGEFGVWNPENSLGQVTGAGFEQLDDIEDILTGGFVNSSTLLILRSKGVSYATLTGNGTEPFDVNHVDLASEGEGCQGQLLSSQYGPVGFYVGNSNIFTFVQQAQPIGDKIKSLIYGLLSPQNTEANTILAASKVVNSFFLDNEVVFFGVFVSNYLFLYNTTNGSWSRISCDIPNTVTDVFMEDFLLINISTVQNPKQSQMIFGTGDPANKNFFFWNLAEQVANDESLNAQDQSIIFPAEEISFGRDITIDGLYVSLAGSPGQQLEFRVVDSISGLIILNSIFTFPGTASYETLASYQIFDDDSQQCTGTGKAPQLSITVTPNSGATVNQLRIAKISMFGSFDPSQRPV